MRNTRQRRFESRLDVIKRRSLTIPLYLLLGATALTGLPLWLLLTALIDLVRGPKRLWSRTRAMSFFVCYLFFELIGVFLATLIWLLTFNGFVCGSERYLGLNAALQRWWTGCLFHCGRICFQLTFEYEGLSLARKSPFVLLVRHASSADTILAAKVVANPNKQILRYVLKQELLWDPCIDIVGCRMPNAFIDRQANKMDAEVAAIADLTLDLNTGSAALIYPEGTRFTPAKLNKFRDRLYERGEVNLATIAERFRHVLPPRTKGTTAMMAHAPHLDVVLLEHAGLDGVETFQNFWEGGLVGKTIWIRLRRFEAHSLPSEKQDEWLYQRWAEMDEWIHQLPKHSGVKP